jgi:hypothetical protein
MRNVSCSMMSAGILLLGIGCGSSQPSIALVPVSGLVTLDGSPVDQAKVTFVPQLETKGNGGWAITDASGKYTIKTPQGAVGVPMGDYKVAISRRLNPDGSPPNPDEPPIESKARETLPLGVSDESKTTLKANVSATSKQFDWPLKGKGK